MGRGGNGIPAAEIVTLAREAAAAKPAVVFHYGYRSSHHPNEIHLRRSSSSSMP